MTFQDKLYELKEESLRVQRDFLKVVVDMRALASKGEAIEERMLVQRDELYHRFNKVLNHHRQLTKYISQHNIFLDSEYEEPGDLI